jgi:hypothetical protein
LGQQFGTELFSDRNVDEIEIEAELGGITPPNPNDPSDREPSLD